MCDCEYCHDAGKIGVRDEDVCLFCSLFCLLDVHVWGLREFEKAALDLYRWRVHQTALALYEEGLDPLEWFPLVMTLGSLEQAERWVHDQQQLDDAFRRACAAGEYCVD